MTKVVVCFSQSVESTKNARAVKFVVVVMFFVYIINIRARAFLLVFEKFTRADLFQIALSGNHVIA